MKEAYKPTPLQIVTETEVQKKLFHAYHQSITMDIEDKNRFEALIPEIVTPYFVALYGEGKQGTAVNEITRYVIGLIKKVDKPDTRTVLDENNKAVVVLDRDEATGKVKTHTERAFNLTKGYGKIQELVNKYFVSRSVYWDARKFVDQNIPTIDEKMFDRMNDYLWRNIMAVYYPEDIKREFKHFCICVKRKLLYLGDRNKVRNQTTFGLYSDGGGNGKTTLLEGLAAGFSNHNPFIIQEWKQLFDFNLDSADKYGIVFVDEDPPTDKEKKDKVKQFIDADRRKIEGKGIESTQVGHLLTLVISANHKISSRLFEDEARGQRRDAFFEVIGNLVQYTPDDMEAWFDKMFAYCPIDDDSKTYHHFNPHSSELTDAEVTVMSKIYDKFKMDEHDPCAIGKPRSYKLGQLSDLLEIKSIDKVNYYALRNLMKIPQYFTMTIDHANGKWYSPNIDEMKKIVGGIISRSDIGSGWSRAWMERQEFIDINKVLDDLKTMDYDCSKPITYEGRWY